MINCILVIYCYNISHNYKTGGLKTIKEQSGTDWKEMYKVFNMGHRLEVYVSPENAQQVIEISKSFNIDAQVVGRIEASDKKELVIESEFGRFEY